MIEELGELMRRAIVVVIMVVSITFGLRFVHAGETPGLVVDKEKKTITIDAKVAPRKLEHLKGEIYPLEVIATLPHPKGKKAHETVVTIEVAPSLVHKAIESLGIKPGAPVMGGDKEPQGPEFDVFL